MGGDPVGRPPMSASSDSRLLDDQGRAETKVVLRHKRPPRPKSECLLSQDSRVSKRYSAFGVSVDCERAGSRGLSWEGRAGCGGRGWEAERQRIAVRFVRGSCFEVLQVFRVG